MAKGHGSQCGFCTPGIVMSMYNLLKINPCPSEHDIEEAFDGNLCRCTGYRPILESTKTFAKSKENVSCEAKNENCSSHKKCSTLTDFTAFEEYDPNCDLPFPAKLMNKSNDGTVFFVSGDSFWLETSNVDELLLVKKLCPDVRIVGGNTELGVDMKIRSIEYKRFINCSRIGELKTLSIGEENGKRTLEIGVGITLTELIQGLKDLKSQKKCQKHEFSLLEAFLSNLRWFASNQIRNFATLAGNVINASPISDLNPIFLASNATITLLSERNGLRRVSMRNFYLAYKKLNMEADEIAVKITIPLPENNLEIYKAYKQAKRKDDDIAIANACFRIKLDCIQKNNSKLFKIVHLNLAFGGLAPTTLYLNKIEETTRGLQFGSGDSLKYIEDQILNEINFSFSVPGGMATYRRTLAVSFFTRFWYQVLKEINSTDTNKHFEQQKKLFSNVDEIERGLSSSVVDIGVRNWDVIGSPLPTVSSINQTTGVAQFTDDIPKQRDELQAALVLSSIAHGFIKNIDASKALEIDGVCGFICHKDIPENTLFGVKEEDEEIFVSEKVLFYGQIIGIVVAESKEVAKKAAALVKVDYEQLSAVVTIEEAIERNSFFEHHQVAIQNGVINDDTFEVDRKESDDEVVEAKVRIGGQEHFYLETQTVLVIPKPEDDQLEVIATSQNLTDVHTVIAKTLGLPQHKIVCKVRRLGGAFGGKDTRTTHYAAIVAVAAFKVKRPVRLVLERDVDMLLTGNRHPFLANYKMRVSRQGIFKAFQVDFVSNAGCSLDLSLSVLQQAAYKLDSAYNIPNVKVTGRLARTNLASNTA
jgi:xanthine dehydrogenase/oxidase